MSLDDGRLVLQRGLESWIMKTLAGYPGLSATITKISRVVAVWLLGCVVIVEMNEGEAGDRHSEHACLMHAVLSSGV